MECANQSQRLQHGGMQTFLAFSPTVTVFVAGTQWLASQSICTCILFDFGWQLLKLHHNDQSHTHAQAQARPKPGPARH